MAQPASELFVLMIFLFIVGVFILFAAYMNEKILTPISDKFTDTGAKGIIANISFAISLFDQVFFFVAIGLGLVTVLLAYMSPARPAFLFLSIMLFAIALVIIPQFSDIFDDIATNTLFSPYTGDYPIMIYIFQNFGLFFWVFGFMILIVLYSKIRGRGEI